MAGPPPVFGADELEAHKHVRASLVTLIRSGGALLFAGAGFSVPAGYPSWEGLLKELEALCDQCGAGFTRDAAARNDDPLVYAERIKTHIADKTGSLDRYHKYLLRRFYDEPQIGRFHQDAVALPFRGFLTTNYDGVIEAALLPKEPQPLEKKVVLGDDDPWLVHEFLKSLTVHTAPRRVAHLHGYYQRPLTIVLSATDYSRTYGTFPGGNGELPVPDFLRKVLSAWSLVFIGFSLRDPQFEAFLRAASNKYRLWGDANHFALMATTSEAKALDTERSDRLRETYGVQAVFYEKRGDSHRGLYDLVGELRQEIAPRGPSLLEVSSRMAEVMRE